MRKRRLSGQFSLRNYQQEHDREDIISTLQLTQIALKLKPKYETRIFQDL